MKKSYLLGLGALAIATTFVSCSEDLGKGIAAGNGRITPLVQLNTSVVTSRSTDPASRADENTAKAITVDDLSLRLTNSDGSGSWNWDKIADFPTDRDFVIGNYTLEAYYGDIANQGFDLPAYSGSQVITVKDGETTTPAITATLANSMVSLKYTDAFIKYMADWSAEINGIEYTKDEDRPVYVTPGDVEIKLTVTKPNGLGATFTLDPVEAEARNHYTVTVSVNDDNVGDAVLEVTFDDNMDEESIEIDLSDKLLSSPEPVITPKGFVDGEPIEMTVGNVYDGELKMNLIAMAGLKEVNLETTSPSLIAQGWPQSIDLMSADAQQQAKLTELGLDVLGLWKTPGEMAVVDFSKVVSHISGSADNSLNTFKVTVKDKLMRESEPVVLALDIESLKVTLSAIDKYFAPGETIDLKVSTNSPNPAKDITFQYKNVKYGTPSDFAKEDVTFTPASRTSSDYVVTLKTPMQSQDLEVRALIGNAATDWIVISLYGVVVNETNVFANYTYATVIGGPAVAPQALESAIFQVKKSGDTSFSTASHTVVDGGYIKITGLTPKTQYQLRAVIDNEASAPATFTTEEDLQLPNGNMDSWYTYKPGGNLFWWQVDYPGEDENTVWGTMNQLTTSEGGTNGGASACGYSSKSGTTFEDNNGGKAALIQTVGWGKGNTAWLGRVSGTSGGLSGGACQHFTAGELYLGHCDVDNQKAVYDGYTFASRPAALKFSYKYTPKNSADWGVAEVHILAADGSEISKKEEKILKKDSYTEMVLPLSYPIGSKKAAKIQVMFKSCGNPDCLAINNNNMDCPPSANASTDRGYIGSKLYVDDIQLTY